MYRIDSPTAGPGNSWVGSDATTGQLPTQATPEWFQMLQETILAPIEAAGIALSTTDPNQLLYAIQQTRGSFGDRIINGGFRVNQRPQVVAADYSTGSEFLYILDRWGLTPFVTGANLTVDWQNTFNELNDGSIDATFAGWTDPWIPDAYLQLTFGALPSSDPILATRLGPDQFLDNVTNTASPFRLDGREFTISWWWNANTALHDVYAEVLLNYGTGGTAREVLHTTPVQNKGTANEWSRAAFSFTIPDLSAKTFGTVAEQYLEIRIRPVARIGVVQVANVGLHTGTFAPPRAPRSWDEEFEACRYFYRTSVGSMRPGTSLAIGPFGRRYYHPRSNHFGAGGSRRWVNATGLADTSPAVQDLIGPLRQSPHLNDGVFHYWSGGAIDTFGGQTVTGIGNTDANHTGDPTLSVGVPANSTAHYDWEADAEFYAET